MKGAYRPGTIWSVSRSSPNTQALAINRLSQSRGQRRETRSGLVDSLVAAKPLLARSIVDLRSDAAARGGDHELARPIAGPDRSGTAAGPLRASPLDEVVERVVAGRDIGRTDEDRSVGRAHPPAVVPVRGREADLLAREHATGASQARPAPRAADDRAGRGEREERAVGHRVLELPPRGRDHFETDLRRDAAPAQHRRRLAHVDQTTIRAGPEEDDVDWLADCLRDIDDLVNARWHRDLRLERRKIDRDLVHVRGAAIREEPVRRLRGPDDDPGLRSHLGGHAGERDAIALRKGSRAVELDALIARAVGADLPDDAHDRVLHRDALAGTSGERDLDRFGNAQPGAPESERDSDVRRTHAGTECANRTVRVRVGIAADDDGAGLAVTLFHHDLVAYALARVVERRDPLSPHPLAKDAVRVGDDRRRRGRGVVDEDGDLRRVPDALLPQIAEPGDDRVDDRVVHHDAGDGCDDKVAGGRVARRDAREDLFGDGLRQRPTPEAASRADPWTAGRSRRVS